MSPHGRYAHNSPPPQFWVHLIGTANRPRNSCRSPSDLTVHFLLVLMSQIYNFWCRAWWVFRFNSYSVLFNDILKEKAVLFCGFKLTKSSKLLGDPGKLQHTMVCEVFLGGVVFGFFFWCGELLFFCFGLFLCFILGDLRVQWSLDFMHCA